MLSVPKLGLNYCHDHFYFTSYLKLQKCSKGSLMQDRIRTRVSGEKSKEVRMTLHQLKSCSFLLKFASVSKSSLKFSTTIIVLQNINLFKLPLFEVRESQMFYYTVPMNVPDLNK